MTTYVEAPADSSRDGGSIPPVSIHRLLAFLQEGFFIDHITQSRSAGRPIGFQRLFLKKIGKNGFAGLVLLRRWYIINTETKDGAERRFTYYQSFIRFLQ